MQRILSHMRKAIEEYNMIDEGDKIAICLSGGKDSITMLKAFKNLQIFYRNYMHSYLNRYFLQGGISVLFCKRFGESWQEEVSSGNVNIKIG